MFLIKNDGISNTKEVGFIVFEEECVPVYKEGDTLYYKKEKTIFFCESEIEPLFDTFDYHIVVGGTTYENINENEKLA